MTALAVNTFRPIMSGTDNLSFIVKSGAVIYAGSLVAVGRLNHADAGYAFAFLPDVNNVRVVGVAKRKVTGSANLEEVDIDAGGQILKNVAIGGTVTQAKVGQGIFLTDDGTFTLARPAYNTIRPEIGYLVRYSSSTTGDFYLYSAAEMDILQTSRTRTAYIPVTGLVATTGGGLGSILNPTGVVCTIIRAVLTRTTKSTGAATADIGLAAGATTSNDTLLDGVDIGATAGSEDNIKNKGTNGLEVANWPAASYVTATGLADSSGLVAGLTIEYVVSGS